MPQTGNSGTISFGSSGFTGAWTQIGAWKPKIGKLDAGHLLTTGFKEFVPDDLADPGNIALKLWFDQKVALPTLGVPETVTVTFPASKGLVGATRAKITGTGFIGEAGTPDMKNGELMVCDVTLEWDGYTGPTFAPETGGSSSSGTSSGSP